MGKTGAYVDVVRLDMEEGVCSLPRLYKKREGSACRW